MSKGIRFKTYHGVIIPPWKEEKMGAGAITIRFVLKGKVPSKKNNQQSVAVRRDARKYLKDLQDSGKPVTWAIAHAAVRRCYSKMRANKEYQDFLAWAKPIIHEQSASYAPLMEKHGITFPLKKATMSLQFYFSNRYVTDTVNKQQTVQDLLIDAKIIEDDDYTRLNPITGASACYADEITDNISFIQITFQPAQQ
jgi:hypothetical protein